MMGSDNLNRHDHGGYTEMTSPSSNVNVTDEDESKEIIVHKNLLEYSSTDISESERNIVNVTLSQNNSAVQKKASYQCHHGEIIIHTVILLFIRPPATHLCAYTIMSNR